MYLPIHTRTHVKYTLYIYYTHIQHIPILVSLFDSKLSRNKPVHVGNTLHNNIQCISRILTLINDIYFI